MERLMRDLINGFKYPPVIETAMEYTIYRGLLALV